MPKPFLLKNCSNSIEPLAGDKETHTFREGISLKVNNTTADRIRLFRGYKPAL